MTEASFRHHSTPVEQFIQDELPLEQDVQPTVADQVCEAMQNAQHVSDVKHVMTGPELVRAVLRHEITPEEVNRIAEVRRQELAARRVTHRRTGEHTMSPAFYEAASGRAHDWAERAAGEDVRHRGDEA